MSPTPQHSQSIEFLEKWSDGLWVLVAIGFDKKREITAATFGPDDRDAVLPWLRQYNTRRNIYFTVNPVIEPIDKKPRREDISSLSWLHVDVDPRVGESVEEEQERILSLFSDKLPSSIPPPTAVVFSGGGYQGFWRLEDPFSIDGDPARYEEAKRWNMQLELMFAGDTCHNVDRIMRLPGTINWPDERKKRKGRVPTLSYLHEWNDVTYPLSSFTAAAPVQGKESTGFQTGAAVQISGNIERLNDLSELGSGVQDYCKVIINQGFDPDNPKKWESRSETVWYVVCELVRSGVDDETIFSVITDPGFAISGHILDQDDPEKSAKRQIERAREYAIHPLLQQINERHAVISDIGGRCRITNTITDPMLGRSNISLQSPADFRFRYMNQAVEWEDESGKTRSQPLGDWWLKHPQRKQFDTIVFAPDIEVPGSYNLWRGFAFNSKPGDCSLFLTHIRENVCDNNPEHYNYLFGWMAQAVQKPASPGHTAVVLRGDQGTGKSYFAKTFGALFGHHFLQVSDSKHLVGSFNSHLRDCVVLFGDEAFYAGDKRHEGVLKTLVTEEMLAIEGKGVNLVTASNCLHIILASNEDWVIPAGQNERRFFVLDVNPEQKQNAAYFRRMQAQLDNGGYEALLHHLRTMDISKFNVRALPQTKALQQQKVFSYGSEEDWWFQKLQNAEVLDGQGWPRYVLATQLRDDYVDHTRNFRSTSHGSAVRLGYFMQNCCPEGWVTRGQLSGYHEFTTAEGKTIRQNRPRIFFLPSLEDARAVWDDKFGGPFEWPEPIITHSYATEEDEEVF